MIFYGISPEAGIALGIATGIAAGIFLLLALRWLETKL
jgi:hypothetical protein